MTAPIAPRQDSTHETTAPETPSQDSRRETMAYVIGVAGWLVPGLGHALIKMWGRAVMCFLTVGTLVILGAGVRGNGFSLAANEIGRASCRGRVEISVGA